MRPGYLLVPGVYEAPSARMAVKNRSRKAAANPPSATLWPSAALT